MNSKVIPAKPYRPQQLIPSLTTHHMLIRQFQFPDCFSEHDGHLVGDISNLIMQDPVHGRKCFEQYLHPGPNIKFEDCVRQLPDERVLGFLKDLFRVSRLPMNREWNGYRILGSVSPTDGRPLFTAELFAKHPDTLTKVYSGEEAPNVHR